MEFSCVAWGAFQGEERKERREENDVPHGVGRAFFVLARKGLGDQGQGVFGLR